MLRDLALPATDAGVYAQAVGAFLAYGLALFLVRRNRDLLVFVVGLATITFALMALRTLH